MVSGAPGAGKTTVVPQLVAQNPGGLVVADFDELLTDGALLGLLIATPAAADRWPAYNALWLRIAVLISRSGIPILLSCPLLPADISGMEAASDASWMLLDCADDERSRRLAARGWPPSAVAEALEDAAALRQAIPDRVDTTGREPADVAREVYRRIGVG